VHALFHKAIRDSLVPSRKAVVSLQVAHSLQENRTEEPTRLSTQLAILYEAGRDYWRASEHLLASARAALRRSANREAIEICTKGLELISNVAGVNKDERELLLTLAKGTAELGLKGFGAAEVRQTFEKARTLCRRQDATEGLAILHGLWMSYLSQTHLHTCLSLAGEILVITKDDPDNEVRAMGYYTLAITQFQMGDAASAIPNFGRAIELYGTPSIERAVRYSFDTRIMAQMELAIAYQWTGCFAQAEALMQEAIATAKPLNHTPTDAIAAGFASGILVHLEQYGEAQRLAHYTNDLCERHALPHWKYVAQFYEGVALASLGDTTAGLKLMRAAIDGMDQIGSHLSRPTFAGFMADILVRIGTCEEALSLIDGQLKRVAHTGEHYYDSRLLTLKGAALLLLGNNNGEKILLEGIDVARKQQFRFFELIGVMTLSAHLAKTGRHSDARATLQPVYDSFSEDSHTPVLQRARTMLHDLN
jgi:tetratricopeptide (TPR) repeat protein